MKNIIVQFTYIRLCADVQIRKQFETHNQIRFPNSRQKKHDLG